MTDDIKKYFSTILKKVTGLQSISVTDRDGVHLIKMIATNAEVSSISLKPAFFSSFTMCCDQSSKLGLGKNKTIISMYSNYQVIQMNKFPLIVTFIGTENCNIGHILSLENQMDKNLEELKLAVTDA